MGNWECLGASVENYLEMMIGMMAKSQNFEILKRVAWKTSSRI
jgi:hypothetical protein